MSLTRYTCRLACLAATLLVVAAPAWAASPVAETAAGECVRCGVDGPGDKADKVSQLTLVYSGPSGFVQAYNDGEAKASELLFSGNLNTGDQFTISASTLGESEFNNEISFFVGGQKVAELHASCSSPLGPGANEQNQDKGVDPNGRVDVTVLSGFDSNGRKLCMVNMPPNPPGSADCVRCGVEGSGDKADKVSQLTLEYSGPAGTVRVYNDGDAKASELLFEGFLNTGDEFTINASAVGEDEFNNEIGFFVNGQKVAELHASCSSPLGPGINEQTQGKGEDPNGRLDITVVSGLDGNGRELCPVNPPPPPPGSADCVRCGVDGPEDKADKVSQLTLMYSGPAGTVRVYNDGDAKAGELLFEGFLNTGDSFTIMASSIGEDEFNNEIGFFVDGQKVAELHASCSSPLGPGTTEQNQGKGEDPNGRLDITVVSGRDGNGRELCDTNPPPPPPGGADCVECGFGEDEANGVSQLTLEYSGAAGQVFIYDGADPKAENLLFSGFLSPGDEVTIMASTIGEDKFSSKVGFYLGGTNDSNKIAEIHTSCSSPVGAGTTEANQEKGEDPNGTVDFTVITGRDGDGFELCDIPPPPPPGADCVRCGVDGNEDKAEDITQLTLRYMGIAGFVRVYNDGEAKADELLFEGFLSPGDEFTIMASAVGEDKLSKEVSFFVGGQKVAELHTSCSSPLGPGTTEANQSKGKNPNGTVDILVVSGRDSSGRELCDVPPPGLADCVQCGTGSDDAEKLAQLTLEYMGAAGTVRVYDNDDVKAENLLFEGFLNPGDTFMIMASMIGEDEFSSKVGFYLNGTNDGNKIAEIHTSCSSPVVPGVTTEANQPKGEDPNGMADFLVRAGTDKDGNTLAEDSPPVIEYSAVDTDSGRGGFIEVRITDDTGITSIDFREEGTNNLELVEEMFAPGATSAFLRYRIIDILKPSRLAGSATDVCGNTLCPAGDMNEIPELTSELIVYDDETGNFQPASDPREPGVFDRFGRLVEVTDDTGLIKYETFALDNAIVQVQPVDGCDAEEGCELDPPQNLIQVVITTDDTSLPRGGEFGFFAADECNVFVFDPPAPSGAPGAANGRTSAVGNSYVATCPAGVPDGTLAVAEEVVEFGLEQNRPNPFGARSLVRFSMPEAGDVHLAVYDMLGRTVQVLADRAYDKGHHAVTLDAAQLPSGTYLYRLTTEHGTAVKQMTVVR